MNQMSATKGNLIFYVVKYYAANLLMVDKHGNFLIHIMILKTYINHKFIDFVVINESSMMREMIFLFGTVKAKFLKIFTRTINSTD